MADFNDALSVSASGLRAQSTRLKHLSENIANVDTPGYRRKMVHFDPAENGAIKVGDVQLDQSDLKKSMTQATPWPIKVEITWGQTSISCLKLLTRAKRNAVTRRTSNYSIKPGKCRQT